MDIVQILVILILVILLVLALVFKSLRKTIGLLLVILGGLACFTVIGAIFGIPMIIVGGLLLCAKSCSFNGTCASYFCLDDKGMVWPCDRLSSDEKFLLGDLRKQKLSEILEGPASMEQAVCAAHLPTDCVECRWKSACNNGCTAMRDPETKKYVYCKSRQKTFEAVENLLLQDTNDSYLPA